MQSQSCRRGTKVLLGKWNTFSMTGGAFVSDEMRTEKGGVVMALHVMIRDLASGGSTNL